jgi:hypothetical protein
MMAIIALLCYEGIVKRVQPDLDFQSLARDVLPRARQMVNNAPTPGPPGEPELEAQYSLAPRRRGSDRLQGSRENAHTRAGERGSVPLPHLLTAVSP